jgi:hypothetical protein
MSELSMEELLSPPPPVSTCRIVVALSELSEADRIVTLAALEAGIAVCSNVRLADALTLKLGRPFTSRQVGRHRRRSECGCG